MYQQLWHSICWENVEKGFSASIFLRGTVSGSLVARSTIVRRYVLVPSSCSIQWSHNVYCKFSPRGMNHGDWLQGLVVLPVCIISTAHLAGFAVGCDILANFLPIRCCWILALVFLAPKCPEQACLASKTCCLSFVGTTILLGCSNGPGSRFMA